MSSPYYGSDFLTDDDHAGDASQTGGILRRSANKFNLCSCQQIRQLLLPVFPSYSSAADIASTSDLYGSSSYSATEFAESEHESENKTSESNSLTSRSIF